jgi:tetratricopeptide (TPR) repeat protein
LMRIKTAINNYRNFKIEELYYKNALITWAFYTNKLYPISILIWKSILREKKDYKPILKIIAKSQYDMWDYTSSKETLTKYYSIDESDPWIAFLLWVVNSKLREYVLSNIFFNKALTEGYSPSIDIRRKLIHNYFLVWNIPKFLSSFKSLVEEKDAETEDIQLAIYYHIVNDDLSFAIKRSKKWIRLFPKEDMFYWYLWWILKERKNLTEAKKILKKWLEINSRNPLILLNIWYVEKMQWNQNKSIVYFKKTIKLNKNWEFWKMAQDELDLIMKEKKVTKNILIDKFN